MESSYGKSFSTEGYFFPVLVAISRYDITKPWFSHEYFPADMASPYLLCVLNRERKSGYVS